MTPWSAILAAARKILPPSLLTREPDDDRERRQNRLSIERGRRVVDLWNRDLERAWSRDERPT